MQFTTAHDLEGVGATGFFDLDGDVGEELFFEALLFLTFTTFCVFLFAFLALDALLLLSSCFTVGTFALLPPRSLLTLSCLLLALDGKGRVVRESGVIPGLNPGGGNFGPDGGLVQNWGSGGDGG